MMFEPMMKTVDAEVARILEACLEGRELSEADAERLLVAEGGDLHALMWTADTVRREDVGDDVTYVVCRNVNFTNICYVGCSFCGFARHKHQSDAYDHDMTTVLDKCAEAIERGATEICMQGGIHPQKNHEDYRRVVLAIKERFPDLHLHAFSPEEIDWGHRKSGMELPDYLQWLMDAGVGSLPGTAAEILDDEIRNILSPRKIKTQRWVEIIRTAHGLGLPTTSTLMYGHIEQPRHVAAHLGLIREIQKETGGFTEFVPLGYIHEMNDLYNVLGSRPGSTAFEDLRLIAVSRLFMRSHIQNIQVSWVKMGHKLGQVALSAGANDFGGTLMEESISRESGSQFGENTSPEDFRRLIREMGRIPVERSTLYRPLRRFEDPALDPAPADPGPQESSQLSVAL
ncbi:5-amino-6-(D-ribitylamino)uracil--L-tyrosine 4-hydroxyphenyl transferase CofH [Myxococcota bacterium]|nr:5-amino-6-(D-ribitylamino)uracil--L-tyrosine 4-hydroxyphenyl transferase CofH [Myxococcota bacterium]